MLKFWHSEEEDFELLQKIFETTFYNFDVVTFSFS